MNTDDLKKQIEAARDTAAKLAEANRDEPGAHLLAIKGRLNGALDLLEAHARLSLASSDGERDQRVRGQAKANPKNN